MTTTRTDEAIEATLRRYVEFVNGGFPMDVACAAQFLNLYRFAQAKNNDSLLESAVLSIMVIWKFLKMGEPSRRTCERILTTVSA